MKIQNAHAKAIEDCLSEMKTSENGLSEEEVKIRLEENGKNKCIKNENKT